MDKFIEAIANADLSAILTLVTTFLSSGFGVALTILASKFLKYKKTANELVEKVKVDIEPVVEKVVEKVKKEIIDELRNDFKVIAESIALGTTNDSKSKLAILENVSKIGIDKEVKKEVIKVIEKEVATKEENKKKTEAIIEKLENNKLETL